MSGSDRSDMITYRISFSEAGQVHMEDADGPIRNDSLYVVGDGVIARTFGARLPDPLADVIDVAIAVYIADRLARRRPQAADRYGVPWSRRFYLRLPVRDPERWREDTLATRLREVLAFLTEDDWHFEFVPCAGDRRRAAMQEFLFPSPPRAPVTVALFSGGLDSLAGLCQDLIDRPGDSFVLFGAGTNSRIMGVQRDLVRILRRRLRRDILPMVLPFGLRGRGGRQYDGDEPTQRSRGFAFQALGAVVAVLAGADMLAVYENGIGAINLPYTAAQLGAQSTRSTHPFALAAMGDFITKAIDRRFAFRLPFLTSTKAEICASLPKLGLADLIGRSISCDGFPQRITGRPQCGLCTSCLLRRQALHAAGLAEYDTRDAYVQDVLDSATSLPPAKLYPLRAMLDQVATLRRTLDRPEPWRTLSRVYPQLVEVASRAAEVGLPHPRVEHQITDLYRHYCAEWDRFPVPWQAPKTSRAA